MTKKIGASKTFLILQATPIVINVHEESIQALQFAQMHKTKGVNPRNFNLQEELPQKSFTFENQIPWNFAPQRCSSFCDSGKSMGNVTLTFVTRSAGELGVVAIEEFMAQQIVLCFPPFLFKMTSL